MQTMFRRSAFTSQHVVTGLLVVFIGLSVLAMFTTSKVGDELKWIGMNVKRMNAETLAARGIPTNVGGVIVEEVGGIAGRAGVQSGDIVVGINGNSVRDMYDFSHFTGEADVIKSGATINVIRGGTTMPVFVFPTNATAQAAVQTVPGQTGALGAQFAISPQWLGIEGDTIVAADALELGVPTGTQGVAIDGVAVGSRAQLAGLATRDVIVAVNGQRVTSARGLWGILGGLNSADSVELGIYRGGQLVTAIVPTAAEAGAAAGAPAVAPQTNQPVPQAVQPVAPQVAPQAAAAVAAGGVFPGRMGGAGLGCLLVCSKCGTQFGNPTGLASFTAACPSCGTMMTRAQQ